jgi:hypothetical protein
VIKNKENGPVKEKETAAVLVILLLLVFCAKKHDPFVAASIIILFSSLILPRIYTLPMKIWFGLSELLGEAVSFILLSLIFYFVVVPMGFFYRLFKGYPAQFNFWKKNPGSALLPGNGVFLPKNFANPY